MKRKQKTGVLKGNRRPGRKKAPSPCSTWKKQQNRKKNCKRNVEWARKRYSPETADLALARNEAGPRCRSYRAPPPATGAGPAPDRRHGNRGKPGPIEPIAGARTSLACSAMAVTDDGGLAAAVFTWPCGSFSAYFKTQIPSPPARRRLTGQRAARLRLISLRPEPLLKLAPTSHGP